MFQFIARKLRGLFTPARGEVSRPAPVQVGWEAVDGFGFWAEPPGPSKAENVRALLDAYGHAYDKGEPMETTASDFLADLFHLISEEGEEPEALVERALMHFEMERDPEPVFA